MAREDATEDAGQKRMNDAARKLLDTPSVREQLRSNDLQETGTYADGLRAAADMLEIPMQQILLAAGEMTAGERRTVKAVLDWRARAIRDAADQACKR